MLSVHASFVWSRLEIMTSVIRILRGMWTRWVRRCIKIDVTYEECSKSFANRYTENTQSIGI